MSFIRTTSCQTIVSKIARTFKPSDSTWIVDCIEDIGWAIQAIGYHAGFVDKETEPPYLQVKHHRARIPCDVDSINAVEWLVFSSQGKNLMDEYGNNIEPIPLDRCEKPLGIQMVLSSDISLSSIGEKTPRTTRMNTNILENTYSINDNYVITGFEKGYIKLYYSGFNIDKDGYPVVLDDFHYKTALEYYCLTQMIHRGFKPSSGIDYRETEQKFEVYRYRAENACKAMGLAEARRFEAAFNRYARGANFGDNFFAGLEQQEYIVG